MSIEAEDVGRAGLSIATDISFLTSLVEEDFELRPLLVRSYLDASSSGAGREKR